MGTTKTTTNTNQYLGTATQAQNTLSNTWTPMVQNPFSGPQYQMGLQQQMGAANQLSGNNIRNALSNANMAGMGNLTGGARASLLSGLGRSASGLRQQGFFNNWNTAVANQQFGSNVLGQLSGQLAGTTSTQKTSGLGTWLPQLLTGGLSLGMGLAGLGGGGGMGGGGQQGGNTLSGQAGAFQSAFSPMSAPTWNPVPYSNQAPPSIGGAMPGQNMLGGMPGQMQF